MFVAETGVMLYVTDVAAERVFWETIGFEVGEMTELSGYGSFSMKPHANSSLLLTVYDKTFIQQVSPEVADHVPSILFEATDLEALHEKVGAVTDTLSPIQDLPFRHFNFASPSGFYVAVKEQ